MKTPHFAKLSKYWIDKILRYVRAFGIFRGLGLVFKLRVAPGFLPPTFKVGDTVLRNTLADICVFEKFYVYREFDEIVAPLSEQTSLLDLGGNIGVSAKRFLELRPAGKVCVVEPAEANLKILRQNLSGFPQATIIAGAVGAGQGMGVISNPDARHDSFMVTQASEGAETAGEVFPVYGLDTLISQTRCSFIKCDVEGAEFDIFNGTAAPNFESVDVAIVEIHPLPGKDENVILNFLSGLGFRYAIRGEDHVFTRR